MKILFAIKNMSNAKGGAERVLSVVMNGLVEKGYDVSLLTFDERGLDSFYKIDPKISRVSLAIGHSGQKAGFGETMARMRAIRRVVQVRKPDIVVPFMHSMFIPVAFALMGMRVPVLASEHIVPMHYRKKWHEYILLMLASLFVNKITVLSQAVRKMYPFFVRRKMVVMPNPVYLFPEEIDKPREKPDQKVILNVGRLSEQKDQKTLVRAFALIADKYPDWIVKIIGEGEAHEYLKSLVKEKGMEGRILLPGGTDRIAREYAQADIFAMPSKYESFGLATAEAMSFGLPVVGFKECAGTNEIVEHEKTGLLVTRSKRMRGENFSVALEALITDEEQRKRLGKQAKKDIVKFQPTIIVKRWDDLISSLV